MNNEQGIMNFEVNTSRQGGTNFIIRNSLFNIRYSYSRIVTIKK